jgi:hypothetical protein
MIVINLTDIELRIAIHFHSERASTGPYLPVALQKQHKNTHYQKTVTARSMMRGTCTGNFSRLLSP